MCRGTEISASSVSSSGARMYKSRALGSVWSMPATARSASAKLSRRSMHSSFLKKCWLSMDSSRLTSRSAGTCARSCRVVVVLALGEQRERAAQRAYLANQILGLLPRSDGWPGARNVRELDRPLVPIHSRELGWRRCVAALDLHAARLVALRTSQQHAAAIVKVLLAVDDTVVYEAQLVIIYLVVTVRPQGADHWFSSHREGEERDMRLGERDMSERREGRKQRENTDSKKAPLLGSLLCCCCCWFVLVGFRVSCVLLPPPRCISLSSLSLPDLTLSRSLAPVAVRCGSRRCRFLSPSSVAYSLLPLSSSLSRTSDLCRTPRPARETCNTQPLAG